MTTIYKYELGLNGVVNIIKMPEGAELLKVGVDPNGFMCLWAIVDTEAPLAEYVFYCIGTGWDFDKLKEHILNIDLGRCEFIDTVVMDPYVWHVFLDLNSPAFTQ